jgi:hypothetical protein
MLASSDEDTPQAPQALQSIDISNIPPDFNFPPTENFQPIVESLIKENTKIYSTMKKTHQQIHYCPYLRQVQEQAGNAAVPLVVEFTPTGDVNNENKLWQKISSPHWLFSKRIIQDWFWHWPVLPTMTGPIVLMHTRD